MNIDDFLTESKQIDESLTTSELKTLLLPAISNVMTSSIAAPILLSYGLIGAVTIPLGIAVSGTIGLGIGAVLLFAQKKGQAFTTLYHSFTEAVAIRDTMTLAVNSVIPPERMAVYRDVIKPALRKVKDEVREIAAKLKRLILSDREEIKGKKRLLKTIDNAVREKRNIAMNESLLVGALKLKNIVVAAIRKNGTSKTRKKLEEIEAIGSGQVKKRTQLLDQLQLFIAWDFAEKRISAKSYIEQTSEVQRMYDIT